VRPYNEPDDINKNAIDVTITIPAELIGIIKQVNVVYREGNLGLYNIFEQLRNPTLTSYTFRFDNNGKSMAVSDEDQTLLNDAIPSVTSAVEMIRNRLFCVLNRSGFDVDESLFDLSITLGSETAEVPDFEGNSGRSDYPNVRYLKDGGIYSVGIVFYDDFGKQTFVKGVKEIKVPYVEMGKATNRRFINWTLTGSPPPGFTKYQIVLSPDHFFAAYFQCVPIVHLYLRDIGEGETNNTQNTEFYFFKNKKFLKLDQIAAYAEDGYEYLTTKGYKYIYLQIPTNIPFIPDTSCLIRFQEGWGGRRFCNIVAVDGEFLVVDLITYNPIPIGSTDPFEPIDWKEYYYEIEIFKPATSYNSVFYEVGSVHNIVAGSFQDVSGRLNGDTYNLRFSSQGRYNMSSTSTVAGAAIPVSSGPPGYADQSVFESPSGLFSATIAAAPVAAPWLGTRKTEQQLEKFLIAGGERSTIQRTESMVIYSLDYERIASDYGRAHTVTEEERGKDFYNIIAFSSPYLENSYIKD